jgi:predicted NUDIX family NTP pyrophosphohydrolase
MARVSAGILLFRRGSGGEGGGGGGGAGIEVLLVHPGGPFWKNKDTGAWSIPKGEVAEGEDLLATARREFAEELGFAPPEGAMPLGSVKQKGGKVVHAWGCEGECDVSQVKSNTFRMEWPPRSGKFSEFPEVDKAAWFSPAQARQKLNPGQIEFLETLERLLGGGAATLF